MPHRTAWICLRLLPLLLLLAGCGDAPAAPALRDLDGFCGIRWDSAEDNDMATGFQIYRGEGGASLLWVRDGRRYLFLPEGAEAPEDGPEVTVLAGPARRIYVAASSAMAYWHRLGAMEDVRWCSLPAEDWEIPGPREAMEAGRLQFVGKYSAPDYERLLGAGCDLAVESTMILHAPKVQEKLEALGIPVFIDYASYEAEPLGRLEWIRAYGLLAGREEAAERFYQAQRERLERELRGDGAEGRTVAFFYFNAAGNAVVRGSRDYIARMIELAGGRYAFSGFWGDGEAAARPSVTVSREDFYGRAREADVLIYNESIDRGRVRSLSDLLALDPLLADCKAVGTGEVWMTRQSLYQASDETVQVILDLQGLMAGEGEPVFFERLSE